MARTRKNRTVYIAGERWKIVRSKLRGKYGECDYNARTIRIHDTLTGTDLLDTLLHEVIHARWPDLLESSVEEFAGTLTTVLDAEGFCRPEDHDG
jgi:hypothetical protein